MTNGGVVSTVRRVARALGVSREGLGFSTSERRELAELVRVAQEARDAARAAEQAARARAEDPEPVAAAARAVYVDGPADPQQVLDLFQGQWASRLPEPYADLRAGDAPLFEDGRITWALEVLGEVTGQRVLELGPLECGHTYMLDRAGAREVVAVEANTQAYLRCLVVKELLGLPSARLLLGDFVAHLEEAPPDDAFDLTVASGVLYHMRDPLHLLELVATRSSRLLLWTHYYDDEVVRSRPELQAKFPATEQVSWRGRTITYHRQEYQAALDLPGFCGGSAPHSNWLSRDGLMQALDALDLEVVGTAYEHRDHPNGPALALAARRRGTEQQ